MRLILSLLLAGSISYAADGSTIAHSRSRPAILRSLSTGIYLQATVIFEGHRAKVRFNRGGQIVLDLDNPVTTESEEIMGVDENHNYWAVYVDNEATDPGRSASFSGSLAAGLLDLLQRDRKDLPELRGANAENLEPFADAVPFSGPSMNFTELDLPVAVEKQYFKQHDIDPNGVPRLLKKKRQE
jgi:hypothetical protein